jgi:uncharacterized protein
MNPSRPSPLPLRVVRTLALHAQALAAPAEAETPVMPEALYAIVEQLGCVQIDTLHMVRRSHYLVLWSRAGQYDPADFDRLIYDPDNRRLFEYWQHAASIIPLAEYRYRLHMMRYYQQGGGWWPKWGEKPTNRAVIDAVRERVRAEGGLKAADFKDDRPNRGTWWDWKPAKHALEYLYNTGEFMIADRVNFQRVYDLRKRVLPAWVDTSEPAPDEECRHHVARAARALGVGTAGHFADYAYMKRGEAAPYVADLVDGGELIEMDAETASGAVSTLLVHRDLLPLIEPATDGALQAERTTFLSPFDSLFWPRDRDQQAWGFRQTLEAYKRAPDRIWGYFCLPILYRDRLVGRFDPKLERSNGTLRLKALYLEPDTVPDDDLIASVAGAMRDFMAWHGATDLVIERSTPDDFGPKLLAAL